MNDIDTFIVHERFRGLTDTTIHMRRWVLTRFVRWLNQPLTTATSTDIETWLNLVRVGPDARSAYLKHLRAFYRWAVLHEHMAADPTLRIPLPKRPRRLPRPIADDALRTAMSLADDPVITAWLYLAAYAGLRCHEIALIRRNDIVDHDGNPVLIVQGKGNKQRTVPLHPEILARLPHSKGYLFQQEDGKRFTARQVSSRLARFFDRNDINATAHQLRHWFGSAAYRESKDLRLVQELMGHASPQTTAGYVAFSQVDAANVIHALKV